MRRDSCPLDCKVYVGNLGNNGNKTELERAFGYYGPLRSVWVARNPPGFAFVEFEDPRDAADAVRELDGRTLCGCRVKSGAVECKKSNQGSLTCGKSKDRPPPSRSSKFSLVDDDNNDDDGDDDGDDNEDDDFRIILGELLSLKTRKYWVKVPLS
ncbi:Serine/arginine-rich splicing factor 3 [Microtus ochrogaster]|uniref:Serine/arginine-rich splicing factor 3 n=1 Tax=Microtus ochrogaster TaxID=79684 RepID=A0A8J6G8J7_MICOH|nr:Serine/arginine-rich splicing factor 3 [Microtus ochrogaster]